MDKQPNVMMISTDHWFADLLGVSGHSVVMTPSLDKIASAGIRFTNCYSECPVCIPARRSLMTGTTPKTHGDRVFTNTMEMPDVPTLAQSFRDAGYQAYAVGKLHVYPQRDRIGFDDALIMEEGRYDYGVVDDYQLWMGEHGYLGQEYYHAMGNNVYNTRPWHLPENVHPTNWATSEMIKTIKRKDPTRPSFYYISYTAPHPPLVPLQCYLDMYSLDEIDQPFRGSWNNDDIFPINALKASASDYSEKEMLFARRAFYAMCTQVDHQIRLLIGTLREESLLDNTIIVFTSDHGDQLFNHGMVAKRVFYENAANVPLIISGKPLEKYSGTVDNRLLCLADIMPTLLSVCDIPIPDTVEGISAFAEEKREILYGEVGEGDKATRMAHDGRYKLIYYPVGNYIQLFDLQNDPKELTNLAGEKEHMAVEKRLTEFLISNFYNKDTEWSDDGIVLKGLDDVTFVKKNDCSLYNQRGGHWPPPSGYTTVGKNA